MSEPTTNPDPKKPSRPTRVRLHHLRKRRDGGKPLTMLTSYDALTARIFDAAGLDMLLVGDSMGNVVLGYDSTIPVTLGDMTIATGAVARAVKRTFVVADLPFGTYEGDRATAYNSAATLMRAGAGAVKLEGGKPMAKTVRRLVDGGIPVMGHLGYTPQSEHALGGPRLQGKGDAAEQLMADAKALEKAGAFAVVLEMVPASVAAKVTEALSIPTIGIGAGPDTDGQVLVWSDMAGMTAWSPSFAKRFAEIGQQLEDAAADYVAEVEDGSFPSPANYREQ